jgi:hypothetical protein
MLLSGNFPRSINKARTIFIPKSAETPLNYRPIIVTSIIQGHYHKILAARIQTVVANDPFQRGFVPADGVAEHVLTLKTVL